VGEACYYSQRGENDVFTLLFLLVCTCVYVVVHPSSLLHKSLKVVRAAAAAASDDDDDDDATYVNKMR